MIRKSKNTAQEKVEPLDVAEQEKITGDLLKEALNNSQRMRLLFCVVYSVVSLIFLVLVIETTINPTILSHQRVFVGIISRSYFQCHYIVSAICFAGLAYILKTERNFLDGVGIVIAIACVATSLLWALAFYTNGVTNIALYWLPLGNIAGLLTALYSDYDLRCLVAEAKDMKNYMYDFKKI